MRRTYDPFKYGSFAINAGHIVYRLTLEIQERITALGEGDALERVPPILAFSSIVDAIVSTPALVEGLLERLPAGGHELVLFDINRRTEIEPVLKSRPEAVIEAFQADPDPAFTLSVVTNRNEQTSEVIARTKAAGRGDVCRSRSRPVLARGGVLPGAHRLAVPGQRPPLRREARRRGRRNRAGNARDARRAGGCCVSPPPTCCGSGRTRSTRSSSREC